MVIMIVVIQLMRINYFAIVYHVRLVNLDALIIDAYHTHGIVMVIVIVVVVKMSQRIHAQRVITRVRLSYSNVIRVVV